MFAELWKIRKLWKRKRVDVHLRQCRCCQAWKGLRKYLSSFWWHSLQGELDQIPLTFYLINIACRLEIAKSVAKKDKGRWFLPWQRSQGRKGAEDGDRADCLMMNVAIFIFNVQYYMTEKRGNDEPWLLIPTGKRKYCFHRVMCPHPNWLSELGFNNNKNIALVIWPCWWRWC